MAKELQGIVTSTKGDKTIVISVSMRKTHRLYKKQYSITNKIMAHDENNECLVGDTVIIAETRPLSRRKRFTFVKLVNRPAIRDEDRVEAITKEEEPIQEAVKDENPKKTAAKPKATKKEAK